jgi:serine O-acetyltransferase
MNSRFAEEVLKVRRTHSAAFPARQQVHRFVDDLIELLFPHISSEFEYFAAEEIDGRLAVLGRDLKELLRPQQGNMPRPLEEVTERFFGALPEIYRKVWRDAQAIHAGDPASESVDEVISAYPGFFAIFSHRLAHEFYVQRVPIFPRIVSEYAHLRTGIDIHPGARIGDSFFIDHGTGVVVGETTIIGDNVKLYQGVSLGAMSVSKDLARTKRHPTIEDNVVIYSNATILGGNTVIGHDSVIGGNVWLTESVPPYSVVYHKSEVRVRYKNGDDETIEFHI